jgi:uncharacterized small protein (DUF1192 family)
VDLFATLVNAFVVLAVGAALTYLTNDRFRVLRDEIAALKADIGGVRGDLKADIARFEERLDAGIEGLKSDIARVEGRLDAGIAAVRSDIVKVALAVGAGRTEAQG